MQTKIIGVVIIFMLLCGTSFYFGRKSVKPQTITKETIKREVETQTVVEEIRLPSGEVRIVTKVNTVEKVQTKIEPSKKNWNLSIGRTIKDNVYQVHVQKNLIGDISIGLYGNTDKSFGLSVGYSF